jgi:hypothetical protein
MELYLLSPPYAFVGCRGTGLTVLSCYRRLSHIRMPTVNLNFMYPVLVTFDIVTAFQSSCLGSVPPFGQNLFVLSQWRIKAFRRAGQVITVVIPNTNYELLIKQNHSLSFAYILLTI